MLKLLQQSSAYNIIKIDKKKDTLSHAYMVSCQDGEMLGEYLRILATLIMCNSLEPCGSCRVCTLTKTNSHPDITFYPLEGKLKTANADDFVKNSIIKPFELDKRLFILNKVEDLNQYQNKLLKSLEEPPKNVYALLSCQKTSAVLQTIKSRVKSVEIKPFTPEQLLDYGKRQGFSGERLTLSASLADGKLSEFIRFYQNDDLIKLNNLSIDAVMNMTSKNLLQYSSKLNHDNIKDFVALLKVNLYKMAKGQCMSNQTENTIRIGGALEIIDKLNSLEENINFNLNTTMLIDSVLFAIMEGRNKWQRLSV